MIIGSGKIGLGAMMVAKVAGASPVIMIDVRENRLNKAREMGAEVILNAAKVDVIPEIVKLTQARPPMWLSSAYGTERYSTRLLRWSDVLVRS